MGQFCVIVDCLNDFPFEGTRQSAFLPWWQRFYPEGPFQHNLIYIANCTPFANTLLLLLFCKGHMILQSKCGIC